MERGRGEEKEEQQTTFLIALAFPGAAEPRPKNSTNNTRYFCVESPKLSTDGVSN